MKNPLIILVLSWLTSLTALQGLALTADFTFTGGCLGTPITFTSISTPDDSIQFLNWDMDMDGIFDDTTGVTVQWAFSTFGSHPVGLQAVTKDGTKAEIYKDVPVYGVQLAFSYDSRCLGQPILFTDLSTVYADSVILRTWNFGDGSPSVEADSPQHTFDNTGIYTVSLRLLTDSTCMDSLIREIVIQPPPAFSMVFSGDTSAYYNDTLLVEVIGSFDSVIWNHAVDASVFAITRPGDYTVSVFREGCTSTRSFSIINHNQSTASIMTLFTPNGDGYNDFWIIRSVESLGGCSVRVFDGWGNLVYENNNYQNTWDGTSDNRPLPSAPYYYVALFPDGQLFKGTVTILR